MTQLHVENLTKAAELANMTKIENNIQNLAANGRVCLVFLASQMDCPERGALTVEFCQHFIGSGVA